MRIMFIVNDLGVNEPFGPMVLSAVLKERGHSTILGVLREEDVERKIQRWKPDLLAYSMMSVDIKNMKKFNNALRRKNKTFTLLGGAHATLNTNCIDELDVDAICVGEGEDAIVEVVERLESGKSIENIPNIISSSDATLRLRSLIEDFDAYPFMDRELVYSFPKMGRFGIKGIWTSRGCAFPCPYCFNNRYNELIKKSGRILRRRSVDSVIRETLRLKDEHRVDFIRIQDDVFVYKVDEWLKDFAKRWSMEVRLPFYCLLRSELITDEMAFYLKEAGCFSICMSIESADDNVRIRMMRRNVTKEQLENAFRIFKKHKINVYANTMLALPFTTLQHDIDSLDFAIKVKPDMPNFSIFMPYPGTDLGDYCRHTGIYDSVKNDITYGMRNMSPLDCFSRKQKEAQYNLCELAIVAVKFPKLRNVIVRYLIRLRPNKIFFLIHYIFAVTTYGRRIFWFRRSTTEYFDLILRTLKHYLYDFTVDKKDIMVKKTKERSDNSHIALSEERQAEELEKCMGAMSSCRVYRLT